MGISQIRTPVLRSWYVCTRYLRFVFVFSPYIPLYVVSKKIPKKIETNSRQQLQKLISSTQPNSTNQHTTQHNLPLHDCFPESENKYLVLGTSKTKTSNIRTCIDPTQFLKQPGFPSGKRFGFHFWSSRQRFLTGGRTNLHIFN